MIDRILWLNGLFFTEIWTNNVSVTFYYFYLRKGTWRFHLYDRNYKITVLLGTAQARGGGGGGGYFRILLVGVPHYYYSPTQPFLSRHAKRRGSKPLPCGPYLPPRPPHGWDFRGRSRLLVIGKMQWLFFGLYPKSFTGACGPLHLYVWGSGRKVG